MSTIEQESIRLIKYNQFKSNFNLLTEIFTEGDTIVKYSNSLLESIKQEIDSGVNTA